MRERAAAAGLAAEAQDRGEENRADAGGDAEEQAALPRGLRAGTAEADQAVVEGVGDEVAGEGRALEALAVGRLFAERDHRFGNAAAADHVHAGGAGDRAAGGFVD